MSVFLGEDGAASKDEANVIILPMPLECSVSYGGGTARGPFAILDASTQVELYDEQLGFEPFQCGVFTDRPVECEGDQQKALQGLTDRVKHWLGQGKWPLILGGEHSLTPAAVKAASEHHQDLVVVQLDAHADLRQSYEGNQHSHACAMARCLDFAEVRAVGIRNYCLEEARWMARGIPNYKIVHAWEMESDVWHHTILEGLEGRPVYLTVDLDYFDPSIIPATGTPEPGGGTWWPTLQFLKKLFNKADVVAADIVELAPKPDLHHADFTAARLAYKLIGMRFPA